MYMYIHVVVYTSTCIYILLLARDLSKLVVSDIVILFTLLGEQSASLVPETNGTRLQCAGGAGEGSA